MTVGIFCKKKSESNNTNFAPVTCHKRDSCVTWVTGSTNVRRQVAFVILTTRSEPS